ncbi:MAG: hypothetical protein KC550_04070 [Nanoarchaeota archaeon]|nr:hypothetical protein [Nanoarchaeota archaeon]
MIIRIEDIIFLENTNIIDGKGFLEWFGKIKSKELPIIEVKYWEGKYLSVGQRHRCCALYYGFNEDTINVKLTQRNLHEDLMRNLYENKTYRIKDFYIEFSFQKKLLR